MIMYGVSRCLPIGASVPPRETPGGPLNFNFPKNFDTSCSMGPCIVVGEADLANIDMETLVNGELRQRFNMRDMVFTFGEYLEYLSRDFTCIRATSSAVGRRPAQLR